MRAIIIGGGKTIYFLAKQFISKGYHVTLINRDAEESKALARQVRGTVVLGDGSNPHILDEAGARQADVVLALTPHDQDNLVACQVAQRMFGVPRTLALVNDPDNEEVFRQLGITVAFSATRIIVSLIERQAGFEEVTNLFPLAEGRIDVAEIVVRTGTPAVGRSLKELGLPEGALVAGIIREGEAIVPRGDTCLQVADRLVLISQPDDYGEVLRVLTGEGDVR